MRKPVNVVNVGQHSSGNQYLKYISEYVQDRRSPVNVMNVRMLSARSHTSEDIREHTHSRNPINVMDVRKLSARSHASENIKELHG